MRELTFKEKLGVLAAILMFVAIGMIMGGNSAGNLTLGYVGSGVFLIGALIALYLLFSSNKEATDEEY
ncbi:MAG: hypothetical protein GXO40_01000 [Epsilonproteobacteria bacterium]|nr:hypothetical protein [Campylobacterota bacterium]